MSDNVAGVSGPVQTRLHRLRSAPAWIAAILAALTVFGPLSMDLYLPVLPNLADDLRTTTSAAQLTMTTCLLGLAFGQVMAGPLSDRYGRRGPLLVGLLVYTAASLLCALNTTIELLVVFRLIQGLAGGVGLWGDLNQKCWINVRGSSPRGPSFETIMVCPLPLLVEGEGGGQVAVRVDLPLDGGEVLLDVVHDVGAREEPQRQLARVGEGHQRLGELLRVAALQPVHALPRRDCLRGEVGVVLDVQLGPDR